ncbi:hypothetical protein [uncultured Flavonifractor sp.]|uniref:hypothetical protein n=1 Tax=uncultured Flavonifractor sp. TaxID=1193534 RepID=UPI0026294D95|nr:hypothetical protein [uncultured Flavonifractor sp.]
MRVMDAIAQADELKPNGFSPEIKLAWLNALEGRLAADVFLMSPAGLSELRYAFPGDEYTAMLVKPPHDDLYVHWLEAKIDYANGEYNKYQNSMQVFNECYGNFVRWFARTYEPAQGYKNEEAGFDGVI